MEINDVPRPTNDVPRPTNDVPRPTKSTTSINKKIKMSIRFSKDEI